jgi:NAD-dependent deacetylase
MKKLVVLSGAGISAESGIKTFRDMGGLWEEYDVSEVATPAAWERNRELVLRFYNERRKALLSAQPNAAHLAIAALQKEYDVDIITQNVDDLHERAGSKNILHLHGELRKARCTVNENEIVDIDGWELNEGDLSKSGHQLRPHIVWFGELVPAIEQAIPIVHAADILLIIGTSLNVYPAAGLMNYATTGTPVYVIDPGEPQGIGFLDVTFINKTATEGIRDFIAMIRAEE